MKITDFFKKTDIILLAVLIFIGIGSFVFLHGFGGSVGNTVIITVNGEKKGEYPLAADRVIDIETEYGRNTVVIENGYVYVSESDCLGHDCEGFGRISVPHQVIMCAPHRLCVTVEGKSDVDAVVY